MKDEVLEVLQRCYENSREPVLLLDEGWNIVWSVRNPGISYLPEVIGVPADSWESCTRAFRLGENRYECSLICNAQDGVRIAVLRQPEAFSVPLDTEVISTAISTVGAACSELHRIRPENADMLRVITGGCYKIYRLAYLQRELDRNRSGFWKKSCFQVRKALTQFRDRIENILCDTVDVEMHTESVQACLEADKDAFDIALLSAIELCYTEPEMRQELEITAEHQDDRLIFTVSMTPTPEERDDRKTRISNFGSLDGERMLLDIFCKEYGGRWMQSRMGKTSVCRIELPASDKPGILTLNAPAERSEGRFFNKYEVLLARIHFRGGF